MQLELCLHTCPAPSPLRKEAPSELDSRFGVAVKVLGNQVTVNSSPTLAMNGVWMTECSPSAPALPNSQRCCRGNNWKKKGYPVCLLLGVMYQVVTMG